MFPRKILPKIHFLCVLALVRSQNYEYSSDEGDTESDIDGDSHPDYSKYYSVTPKEGGIALASFVQPQQIGFGFGPFEAAFGASSQEKQKLIPTPAFIPVQAKPVVEQTGAFSDFFNKNLFGVNPSADYFEQAQTRQREEKAREEPSEEISEDRENEEESEEAEENSEYNQPRPNYISHEVSAKIPHQVETVKIRENSAGSGLNLIPSTTKVQDLRDYKDHHKYLPQIQQSVAPQIYPQAPGYQKFTQTSALPTLTPYQKYSFQPVEYQNRQLENLNSESNIRPNYGTKFARVNFPPYIPQESKVAPRAAERKNCKKLKRDSGNEKIGDLTCYVCENAETNSKVTECSYQSDPASTDLHKGSSERYSVPARRPDGFRYRRYASEEDSDPYEYVKNRSLRAENEKQEEGDSYEYEGYDASQPEKSYSELQSEEILKDPKKCTNVDRDGMTCRVCKDPATGGNYESCSFSTAPEPEKYAYVSEKNYNSNDDPDYASKGDESKNVPTNAKANEEKSEDKKPLKKEKKRGKKYSKHSELKEPKGSKSEYSDYEHPRKFDRKSYDDHSKGERSSYPRYEAESRQQTQVAENEEEEDTKSNSESSEDVSPYKDIGEYKFKYFPEFSSEESRIKEEPAYAGTSKKEVEDVLADFKKKDRSQCKQVKKNGMTCFLCVDENRVKNEECMFISESRPKGTYAKYTKSDEVGAPSVTNPVVAAKTAVSNRKKRSGRKVNEITAADSSKIEKVFKAPTEKNQGAVPVDTELKASASAQDAQRIEEKDDEPKLETPQEFDTTDEGGAYSAETRPVYSKTLGMTLPKYMLDKSDFEKEFDALLVHN